MADRIINILTNASYESKKTAERLSSSLLERGFKPFYGFDGDAELSICIGGDGSFLKTAHNNNFPRIPFVGINTGHLGFYQEIIPGKIDEFLDSYMEGKYSRSQIKLVKADIYTKNKVFKQYAVNEMVLKASHSKLVHINVFIDSNHLEKFSGDGLLISTPSGSTAYNFSSGGAIVHPSLHVLQLNPISPVNSSAYRSLGSSIIVPGGHTISLVLEKRYASANLLLVDGAENFYTNLHRVNLRLSNKYITKLVFSENSYWNNLKDKFL
ncbi:NAD(+)/NADH kinase [Peptoniphilus raoultii]|uniref:NAD(+)/NADH kinase n=1 Tax=Peptoniphilus raoultii TaxID=1776387 RepID=UPI0008D94346|nr:NAD(+)/NADH kinase [Peptoniphilus raoultii]